jgi:hypothetical protein
MKTRLRYLAVVLTITTSVSAQSHFVLTNNVPITEGGMRLIISGGNSPWIDATAAPKELKAGAPVFWILNNTSSNEPSLLWLGGSNSFVVSLKTTNGLSVSKTARGAGMGAGPKSLTDPYTRGAKRIGPSPGHIDAMDFPRLTELFNFPSNGVYVLEVQCWAWSQTKQKFVLSSPVTVRVLQNETNVPALKTPK